MKCVMYPVRPEETSRCAAVMVVRKRIMAWLVQVRENWKSQGKSENIVQSLESQGI